LDNPLYKSTLRSLFAAIALLIGAILGAVFLLGYALQDSLRILTVVGLMEGDIGDDLWIVWPVLGLMLGVFVFSEVVFVARARTLFASTDNPITAFGTSMEDEARSLEEVRAALRRYALFIVPVCIAIGLFITLAFVNILLVLLLIGLQIGMVMFFFEKAAILKADARQLF